MRVQMVSLVVALGQACTCDRPLRTIDDEGPPLPKAEAPAQVSDPWVPRHSGQEATGPSEEPDSGELAPDAATVDAGAEVADAGAPRCGFAMRVGGSHDDRIHAVVVAPNGDVYAGGVFRGTADFGRGPVNSQNDDGFVMWLPADGGLSVVQTFGGALDDGVSALSLAPDGTLLLAGYVSGPTTLGSASFAPQGLSDGLVARLSATLQPLWVQTLGGTGRESATSIVAQGGAELVVLGTFESTMTVGGRVLASRGLSDVFLAQFSLSGAALAAQAYGGTGVEVSTAVTSDSQGQLTLGLISFSVPLFPASVSLGGPALLGGGRYDFFIGHYARDLKHLWSVPFGGGGDDWVWALAAGPNSDVWLTGHFTQTMRAGTANLVSAGGEDAFLISLAAANGAVTFASRFGGPTIDKGRAVAVSPTGTVWLTGFFTNAANFGGATMNSIGGADVALAAFHPSGTHVSSTHFGGPASWNESWAMALGPCGPVVGGEFKQTVAFTPHSLTSVGSADGFVVEPGP